MGGLQIMKHKTKPIVIIILTAITALLITFRIIYVNNTLYSIPERYIYAVNEEFECYGMSMSLSDYKIYSGEKLNNIYNNELEGMTDDNDIMFNLTIKNTSDKIKSYNAIASGIMYGYKSGGSANPYLYQYFNPKIPGIIEIAPNESVTVTLAFPCDKNETTIEYVASLYPENVRVKLR